MLEERGGPGAARKKFPCRGGESIRRRSTSTLSNRRLDIPYSSPPSLPRFERIIIGGTRTQEPLFATERGGEAYDFSSSRLYSAFSPPLSSDTNTRKKARLTKLLHGGTRPHAGGATVPHYHTIFMLAPPGPQSCTTKHYT